MSTVKKPQDFTDDEIEESLRYAANKLGFVEGFREQQRTALKSFLSPAGRAGMARAGTTYSLHYPTGFGKVPFSKRELSQRTAL